MAVDVVGRTGDLAQSRSKKPEAKRRGRPIEGNSAALKRALQQARRATSVDELRAAQAVLLPLQFRLTNSETAIAVGRSEGWVSRTRREFIGNVAKRSGATGHGGRRHGALDPDEALRLVRVAIETAPLWLPADAHGNRSVIRVRLEELLAEHLKREDVYPALVTRTLRHAARTWFNDPAPWRLRMSSERLKAAWKKGVVTHLQSVVGIIDF